jgi:hypothetical protein
MLRAAGDRANWAGCSTSLLHSFINPGWRRGLGDGGHDLGEGGEAESVGEFRALGGPLGGEGRGGLLALAGGQVALPGGSAGRSGTRPLWLPWKYMASRVLKVPCSPKTTKFSMGHSGHSTSHSSLLRSSSSGPPGSPGPRAG